MICELHCHTSEHSACSFVAAADLVRRAWKTGMQTVILTDHHYQWTAGELTALKESVGLPDEYQILSGQEVNTRDYGHVLVYGGPETVEQTDLRLKEIRRRFPEAALVWAHPYRDGRIPSKEKLLAPLLDGVEIFNANYAISETIRALNDWHQYKFTALGGTDTHALSYVGSYPTLFDHPFETIEGLAAEIRAGRCRPYFKEIPLTGTSKTRIIALTTGPKSTGMRQKHVIKTFQDKESWQDGERKHRIVEALYNAGFNRGPYRVPRPLDQDADSLSIIEEQIQGQTLADALEDADEDTAKGYMKLAAKWLSTLHNLRLAVSPADEFLKKEPERLSYYLRQLQERKHRYLKRVRQIRNHVLVEETQLIRSRPEILVQSHGDYHPKNIYIVAGREESPYAAAVDFNSSYLIPRAFDVGTFLAQYINMFFEGTVRDKVPASLFFDTYVSNAENLDEDFHCQVQLFKARTCLSILYYLSKVGMSDSENFWRILVEAEKSLAGYELNRCGADGIA